MTNLFRSPSTEEILGFKTNGLVRLPGIVPPVFGELVEAPLRGRLQLLSINDQAWSEYSPENVAMDAKLKIVLNNPVHLAWATSIMGEEILQIKHRSYLVNRHCNHLTWHDDSYDDKARRAALRIELSKSPYVGGDFHFRNKHTKEIQSVGNLSFGEGILFKVEFDRFEHMVDPVTEGDRKSIIFFFCAKL